MKKVNWGIIGLGKVAEVFAKSISNSDSSNLTAISSTNFNKLEKFRKNFHINDNLCFLEYEDLINSKEPDIVYISLPNSMHYKFIKKCIEKGKNVIVEKPATLNFKEINELKYLINEKKIFFGEAFMYRYHPKIDYIINAIKQGKIGNLLSMETVFGVKMLKKKFFGLFYKEVNFDDRLFNTSLGGGVILDMGCYPTSMSILISRLKQEFKTFNLIRIKKNFLENDIDIHAEAEIVFDNGFQSKIKTSFIKNLGSYSIIRGDEGEIKITDTWLNKSDEILINNNKVFFPIKNNDIYIHQIESINQSILNNKIINAYPGMSLNETCTNMKILDEWRTN